MRLTAFTDYSLRVLIYLAASGEGRATVAEIARAFGISENHLVKVVHLLGREGYLNNRRGRSGGLELSRPASEISVGRVVRLTEGQSPLVECFDAETNSCVLAGGCGLQNVLAQAEASFYATLDRYTVADLKVKRTRYNRLMERLAG